MYRLKSRAGRVMPAGFFVFGFYVFPAPWWQGGSEGFREVFGSFVDVEFFVRFPEVQHVPLNAARWVEAAEHLTLEIREKLPS